MGSAVPGGYESGSRQPAAPADRTKGRPAMIASLFSLFGRGRGAPDQSAGRADSVVGTWIVTAPDAPFPHHVFVFNADGTMQQANPDAGNAETSDSDGKGIWERRGSQVEGKFVEFTADRATHRLVGRGEVSFEIAVDGDRLTGTAVAHLYGPDDALLKGPLPTSLEGKRLTLP